MQRKEGGREGGQREMLQNRVTNIKQKLLWAEKKGGQGTGL